MSSLSVGTVGLPAQDKWEALRLRGLGLRQCVQLGRVLGKRKRKKKKLCRNTGARTVILRNNQNIRPSPDMRLVPQRGQGTPARFLHHYEKRLLELESLFFFPQRNDI